VRWEAWPALLATLAWALFLGALVATYLPGPPLEWLALLVIAGVPLAICLRSFVVDRRRAEWSGRKPSTEAHVRRPWLVRLFGALVLSLVVLGSVYAMLAARSSLDFGFDSGPVVPGRLLPGASEIWAYVGSLALTTVIASPTWQGRLTTGAALAVCVVIGGGIVIASRSGLGAGALPGGCSEFIRVVVHSIAFQPAATGTSYYSRAEGELDGVSLGTAAVNQSHGHLASVRYDTRWGTGSHELYGEEEAAFGALRATLTAENLVTADDLGIDAINDRPTRHCQLVIDGRSAVRGFLALRWLTGGDETTADPGAGLEAWRGLLDYWIVRAPQEPDSTPGAAGHEVVLAAVRIDGPPPGWPWPGLRAALSGSIFFGF
jgi:hypothetical protein